MKILSISLMVLVVMGCSEAQVEEFAFRKTLEFELIDLCGEEDKACISAVKTQISGCMEQSDWRTYLSSQEDEEELKRFTTEFYACIVDPDGEPYFESNV